MFGHLVMEFQAFDDGTDDTFSSQAVIQSIETRWHKADQEVFIAAVLLNPLLKVSLFAPLDIFTRAGIQVLFERLWCRFHGGSRSTPPAEFYTMMEDYLRSTGKFADLEGQLRIKTTIAAETVILHGTTDSSFTHHQIYRKLRLTRLTSTMHSLSLESQPRHSLSLRNTSCLSARIRHQSSACLAFLA